MNMIRKRIYFNTLFSILLSAALFSSCHKESHNDEQSFSKNPWIDCYYKLVFTPAEIDYTNLSSLSLHLSDNYWVHGKLSSIPLRFDEVFFISHDCSLSLDNLILDTKMRSFMLNNSVLEKSSEQEYKQMIIRSKDGHIIVDE